MCDKCLDDFHKISPEIMSFFAENKERITALATDFAKHLNANNMGLLPEAISIVDSQGGEELTTLEEQDPEVQKVVGDTMLWMNQFHALAYLTGFWTAHEYKGEEASGRFGPLSMEQAFYATQAMIRSGIHDGMSYGYGMSQGAKRKNLN